AEDLKAYFKRNRFDAEALIEIKEKYNASTEMFVNRLANIIPKFFKLNELFLFTFRHQIGSFDFTLEKELHLSGLHSPHANLQSEYYCRRWKALSIIKDFEEIQKVKELKKPFCGTPRSRHIS